MNSIWQKQAKVLLRLENLKLRLLSLCFQLCNVSFCIFALTMIWNVALIRADAGYKSHTLSNSIHISTSGNKNFSDDNNNSGAFVRYGRGRGPSSEPEEEEDRIIGGNVAEGDQFVFMAFVYYNQEELSYETSKSCSATLIDPQWLLTAAHCLTAHDGTKVIYSKWSAMSFIR